MIDSSLCIYQVMKFYTWEIINVLLNYKTNGIFREAMLIWIDFRNDSNEQSQWR